MPSDPVSVLLEGGSDVAAVRVLALRAGIDLNRVRLVDLGGVTNAYREMLRARQRWPMADVLGLCDAGEADVVVRALRRHGRSVRDATDLPSYGFFVCVRDLEDELIRALGDDGAVAVIDRIGLRGKLATLRGQQAWRDRPLAEQLHRFCGIASGRKAVVAQAFAEALAPEELPEPLRLLVDRLPRAPR